MSQRRSEAGSGSGDRGCASTRSAIEGLARDGGLLRDPATRAHLRACSACHAAYRAHVEGLADLARRQRTTSERAATARSRPAAASERAQDERALDEHRGVRDAVAALQRSGSTKQRTRQHTRQRARLVLGPAVLALGFLFVQRLAPGDGSASAHGFESLPIVTPVAGSVQVADRHLAPDESALLARGAACRTAASSRARIVAGRAELELGPETYVQVESKSPPRLRLALGELTARGPCTITTAHGVAELGDGAELTIRLGWNGIALEHGRGDARWCDAGGERALGDGTALDLARALPGPDGRDAGR